MKDELIKETKPGIIVLGDKEYKLSPLNLNVLANIETEFNSGLAELGDILGSRQASSLRTLLYILIKDNHPDMTKDKIGELVLLDKLAEITEALTKALTG